ncbi:hypothetical protein [Lacihabitans soyangensis]|uniref:Uncharacterized protein n=1 Tax=Lacihabitans soyangensis TaxID=869394 RepID=A0AAE3KQU7_9BACT|nr:hypothetical protein [Lacihabitans soyangensis]MCP9761512.1 hypothetical protein [Lacihabitans soyangensis]
MKIKDLTQVWIIGNDYVILNLPIVTYSVQPHWRNNFEPNNANHRYIASFKSSIILNQTFENEYKCEEDARKGCEKHLTNLLEYLFTQLNKVVEIKIGNT